MKIIRTAKGSYNMNRNQARETVMQLVFSMEIQQDFSEEYKYRFLSDIPGVRSQEGYIDALSNAVMSYKEIIDGAIEASISISPVDPGADGAQHHA